MVTEVISRLGCLASKSEVQLCNTTAVAGLRESSTVSVVTSDPGSGTHRESSLETGVPAGKLPSSLLSSRLLRSPRALSHLGVTQVEGKRGTRDSQANPPRDAAASTRRLDKLLHWSSHPRGYPMVIAARAGQSARPHLPYHPQTSGCQTRMLCSCRGASAATKPEP